MPAELIEFETARLNMRPFRAADLPFIFTGLSNPLVAKYYGIPLRSMNETRKQLRWYQNLQRDDSGLWLALFEKNSAEVVGATGFNNRQHRHRKAEIGFWILPKFWQQGFTGEAMARMLDFAFAHWKLHRIEACIEPENTASRKLLEKFGFRREGRLVDCEIKNQCFISLEIFALLRSAWQSNGE